MNIHTLEAIIGHFIHIMLTIYLLIYKNISGKEKVINIGTEEIKRTEFLVIMIK